MATQINNTASVTYGYGRSSQSSAVSNVATTNLIEDFAIFGSKTPLNLTYRPGENITYQVYVRNDGTQPLYNITIADNLGGTGTPLSYVAGTGSVNIAGVNSSITPTITNPLTFILPSPLDAGEQATLTFVMRVNPSLSGDVTEIINTATISANEGSTSGAVITVDPAPTSTITLEDFALVTIDKAVSSNEVFPGQAFDYIITLENSGVLNAEGVVVTDVLPDGFVVNSITATSNGTQTTYNTGDYTIEPATNTLTLPTGSGAEIVVPAAVGGVNGVTVVQITGTIS